MHGYVAEECFPPGTLICDWTPIKVIGGLWHADGGRRCDDEVNRTRITFTSRFFSGANLFVSYAIAHDHKYRSSSSGIIMAKISIIIATMMMAPAVRAQPPYFTASPTSGRAPLTVTFCASAGIAIDFGDGTSSAMGMAQSGDCLAGSTSYVKHIFTAAGTYQLRGFPCPSPHDSICGEVAQQASAVTIAVTPGP